MCRITLSVAGRNSKPQIAWRRIDMRVKVTNSVILFSITIVTTRTLDSNALN